MSEHEYNDLLFEISKKIDVAELERLVFMCRSDLPKACMKDSITTVLTLFEELEKNNRLGIDRLDTLKNILTLLKKRSLLKKVDEFEAKRKGWCCIQIYYLNFHANFVMPDVRYAYARPINTKSINVQARELVKISFCFLFYRPLSSFCVACYRLRSKLKITLSDHDCCFHFSPVVWYNFFPEASGRIFSRR